MSTAPPAPPAPPASGPAAGEDAPLARTVGRKVLLLFVVGDILGAGIYSLTGKVAGEVGGAIWVPFLVAFGLAALTAASYVELVGKYPRAAGAALYAHKAFDNPFVTFMVAFTVMMSGVTSAAAAARAFGGDYLAELVSVPTLVAAYAFLALVAVVNLIGISESMRVNVVLTLIEASGLLVVLVIGAWAVVTGDGEPSRALDLDPGDASVWTAVLGGTALAFYALLGFEDSVNLAEECQEPRRDFGRALFGGLAITGVVYLAVAFTSTLLVDTATLRDSTGPLLEVVKVAGLAFPPTLFAVIALFAVGNTALINMIMASRLVYGMAREGIVPPVLGRVSRRRTPSVAIAFTIAIALTLVSTGDLAGLADTTVLLLLLVFAVVNVAVLVLRREPAESTGDAKADGVEGAADAAGTTAAAGGARALDRRGFRAPTWAPVLGAVVSLVLASPLTGREDAVYVRAALLLGIGVALYGINRLLVRRAG
ncbi:APC family permease [Cellulomonas sp. NS3]|uniref:APC family permease n=1 Tax=Cellulomonas sp. NS3 TaxID=2973977 RepID=UPI002163DB01|nr:APC family permease [Cellulomonas sp. NS3]